MCVRLCRCACTFILGAAVCVCYLYVNVFTLLRYVVYLRVHLRRIHQSVSSLHFGITASFHERRIHHAIAQRSSHTGCLCCCFFNSLARLFRLVKIRCAAGQTCWLGMKVHLMQGAQLFPWRACLFSDHSRSDDTSFLKMGGKKNMNLGDSLLGPWLISPCKAPVLGERLRYVHHTACRPNQRL